MDSAANNNNTQQSPPLVYVRRKSEGLENTTTTAVHSQQEDIIPQIPMPPPSSSSGQQTIANPKLFQNVHWEDRYQHLHMFLRKLDQSDQAEYIQMLHSLSSVELSRHAVELEKRSIQLSLEEAKELQRVAALNVLGKSVKNFKTPADHGDCSDKLKTSA